MAEAHGPEDLGGEEQPFDVDPDLIDDADDDGGMGAIRQEPQPEKKRGRPHKKQQAEQLAQEARRRAFVESNVKTSMAKTDLMEVMNRYDWDSGEYDAIISRVQPQTWHGRNIQGYIASFPHAIDEYFIGENFGGGVYDIKVRGPNPRQGGSAKGFLDGARTKVSGDPKVSPMERSLAFDTGGVVLSEPQPGPPSQKQMAAIRAGQMPRSAAEWNQPAGTASPDQDTSLVKMSFNMLAEREKVAAREAASMRERLISEATTKAGGDSLTKEALRLVQDAADKAIEAERMSAQRLQDSENKHREDFERMLERMSSQKQGIPHEMIQTLTEQHRSELATAHQTHINQITQAQERHERDINALRERYERELNVQQDRSQEMVNQVRVDLQGRLDRLEEQYKREQERERERYQAELAKVREDADRRFLDAERDQKSRFERAQEDWQRRLDQAQGTALSERESLSRSHQMQIDHLKALHDGQLAQERSQRDSLMAQIKAQNEASMKMMETSYTTQIDRLTSELDRTRSDLEATRSKVTEQGDLASQAEKLKRIGDSLGSVFGLGGGALASIRSEDSDIEPRHHQEEPKTWFGKLMQFANTDMGAGVFDFLKIAMASAAGGAYPPGSVPMMPMMPQQQPMYGPPQGYHQPPGYGPTSYAQPHSQYPQGQMPYQQPVQYQQQGRVVDEDEYEEVEEEVEEGGEAQGSFVDDQRAEPAGPAPEAPPLRSPVRQDGVVTQQRPPIPAPVRVEAPKAPMPEADAEQLRVLVKSLEGAMNNGVNPAMMAQTIASMAPPEQLRPFVNTPIEQLMGEVMQVSPESQLTTYAGRKFLMALQQSLKQLIG